ncbi:MAG: NAD-dependent epimerase/dehydratase family protein, partial [Bacteroidia bacterium]|nr:NAD-dependent epimerase/dehydratase family protein [Bacteroidia bacterium]
MTNKVFHNADLSGKTFAVTGGAGFIGSHLAEYLVVNGAKKVIVLDDLSNGTEENLKSIARQSNLEFIKGSICDAG